LFINKNNYKKELNFTLNSNIYFLIIFSLIRLENILRF